MTLRLFIAFLIVLWGVADPLHTEGGQHSDFHANALQTPDPVVLVHSKDYKPLFYVDSQGHSAGVLADYWRLWSRKSGVPIHFEPLLWHECIERARSQPGVVIPGIFYTPERDRFLDFSQAFLDVKTSLFSRRKLNITSTADITSELVGVTRGDRLNSFLAENAPLVFLKVFDGFEAVVAAAAGGEIDLFAMDNLCAEYYLNQYGIDGDFKAVELLYVGKFCAAVKEGDLGTLKHLNGGIEQINRDEIDDILEKWLQRSGLVSRESISFLLAAFGFILLGGGFAAIILMRRKIRNRTSELNLAVQKLAAGEKKYRSVFENTGAATVIIDENTTIIMANSGFEKLSGYSREELEGKKSWKAFVVKEDLDEMLGYHRQRRGKQNAPTEYEFRFVDRRDGVKNVLNRVDAIPGTMLSVASLLDITSLKKTEAALRESRRMYRELVENIAEVIYTNDPEGMITYISPAISLLTGYRPDEIVGQHFSRFVHRDDVARIVDHYERIILKHLQEAVEFRLLHREGHVSWVRSSAKPNIADGRVVSVTGVISDISDLKKAEEEKARMQKKLQQAQKMEAIGTLAGGVAHDLNNILSGLVSYPELLLLDMPEDSRLRKPILTIQRSGEKAAAIVQDLLTLARRGVNVTELVDLNQIVTEFLGSPEYEKIAHYHPGLLVEKELGKDLLKIVGSPVHLSKTIMNLVSNGAEAMPSGGSVRIQTENQYIDQPVMGYDDVEEGDYVVVTISDTGVGIAREDLERIFEPFFTKKVMGRSGTGLGMAVVWGTVKDHCGYVDVQSIEGQGTTFRLYFPATRKEIPLKESGAAVSDLAGNGETILVVDDVADQREIATKMLQKLNYSVASVASGEEALAYLRENRVDLLLLDMILEHGMDGLETYRRIVAEHPNQKAIIASGFSESQRVKDAQKLGAGVYVKKPYLMEKIGYAIKAELLK